MLGIGSREDSYTDLVAYAFEHSPKFNGKLLKLLVLDEKDHGNWKDQVRPQVPIKKSQGGRTKDIPDLILFSKKRRKVILIENKLFSGEGLKQTKRYASNEFKNSLEQHLKIKFLVFKFFFLTLDGTKPCSRSFETISYLDISNCIPQNLGSSKLDILLEELRERIDEYYSWPLPNEDAVVLDYLNNRKRLVNSYRTFRIVADKLFDPSLGFLKDCDITANRGSGYIPLCLWYKERWRSKEYPEEKDGAKCYNIHFEFQWDTREDRENLTIYLHYETNPYMAQKELKKVGKHFIEEHRKARDKFYNYIKGQSPSEWNISKTFLRIAYYTFDKEIRFGDLKKKVNSLIESMTNVVEAYPNSTAYNTA